MQIESKLPKVGTTIFTVMSQLAATHQAVNPARASPISTVRRNCAMRSPRR